MPAIPKRGRISLPPGERPILLPVSFSTGWAASANMTWSRANRFLKERGKTHPGVADMASEYADMVR